MKTTRVFLHSLASYDTQFDQSYEYSPAGQLRRNFLLAISLILFCMVCFFPSLKVSGFIRKPAPFQIPTDFSAGDVLSLPDSGEYESLWLGNHKMSYAKKQKIYLGARGMYQANSTTVLAFFKADESVIAKLMHWIYGSPLFFSEEILPVRIPDHVKLALSSEETAETNVVNAELESVEGAAEEDFEIDPWPAEQAEIQNLIKNSSSLLLSACWMMPIQGSTIAHFGDARTNDYDETFFHSGIDIAPTGKVNVKVSNSGEVILAENRALTGNTVMVDHGGGFVSRYTHLNNTLVKPGATLKTGQVIGTLGSATLESPHLHWEILWNGVSVNPQTLLTLSAQLCGSK